MSSAEHFVRHHKQQTDRAISEAYARLATDPIASATFHELLLCARSRARRLFDAPIADGRHPGVDALVNLARFTRAHIRVVADWGGTSASWRAVVCSLAQHLVGRYAVPAFLGAAWYATDDHADRKREWFIAHAQGARFRSLDLPIAMTSKMEHLFLSSRDHLSIEQAMRGAELRALGASDALVKAVLASEADTGLRDGAFWRTVWAFLIANAAAVDVSQIGPIVDFVSAIRVGQPSFSMKGRTAGSILRLMQAWHRSLGLAHSGVTWARSPLRPMTLEEESDEPSTPPTVWHLMELTNGAALRAEGHALHHCVASYADRCRRGLSRIWSLRVRRGEKLRHVLTIEVDMKRRAVVQARGWHNRFPSGRPLRLLREWTVRERLTLAV